MSATCEELTGALGYRRQTNPTKVFGVFSPQTPIIYWFGSPLAVTSTTATFPLDLRKKQ